MATLWSKGADATRTVEDFTVGNDRVLDLRLAKYDVQGSKAHIRMLESIGLLTSEELEALTAGLDEIAAEIEAGSFVLEDDIEDIHSQVEMNLTRKLGDIGKKIHSGRSRNDQVLVDIKLFYTYLRTGDNKIVVIPNSKASNSVIINYTRQGTRRDDITFNISYDSDFEKAKEAIRECIESCDKILKDPAPLITLSNHGQNSLDILARYYTKTDDFWDVHWYMVEAVKKAFDKYGISIPYPQLDVHIANNDAASSKNK